MDGIFKKIALIFLFLAIISCKKDEKPISSNTTHDHLILEGKNLIRQNINVLIDSVIQFDVRLPNEKNDLPKITIGLIDSIPKRQMKAYLGRTDGDKFVSFKLENTDLKNFKSSYKLNLVKAKNNDVDIVFVTFAELRIDRNDAYVVVKKVRGIGMIKSTYYFKKENGIWTFIKKDISSIG